MKSSATLLTPLSTLLVLAFVDPTSGCVKNNGGDGGGSIPITSTQIVPTTPGGATSTATPRITTTIAGVTTTARPVTTTAPQTTSSAPITTTSPPPCPDPNNPAIYLWDTSMGITLDTPVERCDCDGRAPGELYVYEGIHSDDTQQILDANEEILSTGCIDICMCNAEQCYVWDVTMTNLKLIPYCNDDGCTTKVVIEGDGGLINTDENLPGDVYSGPMQHENNDVTQPFLPLSSDKYPSIDSITCELNCFTTPNCATSSI